jgi:hypothetical protein
MLSTIAEFSDPDPDSTAVAAAAAGALIGVLGKCKLVKSSSMIILHAACGSFMLFFLLPSQNNYKLNKQHFTILFTFVCIFF